MANPKRAFLAVKRRAACRFGKADRRRTLWSGYATRLLQGI
jgi:hypothetical protein